MGTIYYVGCKDCKVVIDLDKFYTVRWALESRADALKLQERAKADAFRCGMLAGFMGTHQNHNCVLFDEHNDELREFFHGDYPRNYDNLSDYWKEK